MSEAKHTPGPWTVLPEELDRDYIRIRGTVLGGRYKIANVLHPCVDDVSKSLRERELEETRANVRLIAAAPKLLEACEAYYYGRVETSEAERMMAIAIAEARGEL